MAGSRNLSRTSTGAESPIERLLSNKRNDSSRFGGEAPHDVNASICSLCLKYRNPSIIKMPITTSKTKLPTSSWCFIKLTDS
jgi:hypothetical protein